jgi:hypothetical protein
MASNINPNNIDGSYPVAGQDNNSQGFRDNFTNTKTNFQYAEDEINDLQNKVVLKAALTGGVLDNNMNDNLIYAAKIQDFSATRVAQTTTSGTVTLNYASGHYQTITTTGSVSLAFTNWPSSGSYGYMRIQIDITNVAYTMTLPASVSLGLSGIQGISPGTSGVSNTITFGAIGKYEFAFSSSDGGATITLFDLNRALTNFTAADISTDDITATGFISAAGNVTGGNLRTAGSVSATGNIVSGNVTTGGAISATANITGGNIRTAGSVSATGNVIALYNNSFVRPTAGTSIVAPLQFTAGTNLGTATAGAFEYDGTVMYSTPSASQRGLLPSMPFVCSSGDYVLADSNSAQAVFAAANDVLTLPGSTTYMFEALYYITRAAGTTSHTISTLFGGTVTYTSITYIADTTSTTGNVLGAVSRIYGTAATALIVTGASTSATENVTIKLNGVLRTNASGTFIPQIQYSAAPGGAPTVVKNSYFKLIPIGNSSVVAVGNWG